MRVRTLVALAHVSLASGLATKEQIIEVLDDERARISLQTDNYRFLRRGIGNQDFQARGHHLTLGHLENKVQMINQALGRL